MTAPLTRSQGQQRSKHSSRRSSGKPRSNGCGPTGAGISPLRFVRDLGDSLSGRNHSLRCPVGIGNLVGESAHKIRVLIGVAVRLAQRIVDIGGSGLVGEHATKNRPVAQGEREPFRGDGEKVERAPWIEYE